MTELTSWYACYSSHHFIQGMKGDLVLMPLTILWIPKRCNTPLRALTQVRDASLVWASGMMKKRRSFWMDDCLSTQPFRSDDDQFFKFHCKKDYHRCVLFPGEMNAPVDHWFHQYLPRLCSLLVLAWMMIEKLLSWTWDEHYPSRHPYSGDEPKFSVWWHDYPLNPEVVQHTASGLHSSLRCFSGLSEWLEDLSDRILTWVIFFHSTLSQRRWLVACASDVWWCIVVAPFCLERWSSW